MSGYRHEAYGPRPVTASQRRRLCDAARALNFSDVYALVDYYYPGRMLSDLKEVDAHELIVQCKIELNMRYGAAGEYDDSVEE